MLSEESVGKYLLQEFNDLFNASNYNFCFPHDGHNSVCGVGAACREHFDVCTSFLRKEKSCNDALCEL